MKVIKLESEMKAHLAKAKEVNIAVAIMTNYGLELLKNHVSEDCKVNLLIGIDLLTPVDLFRQLLDYKNPNWAVKVFRRKAFFHTKLYIVQSNESRCFIGSGNFTEGGLGKHVELFCCLEGKAVDEYNGWFDQYFKLGEVLDESFIKEYEPLFNRTVESQTNASTQLRKLKRELTEGPEEEISLEEIDFTNQFFKYEHHNAFTGNKSYSFEPEVDQERLEVKKRLYDLHDLLSPKIKEKGWDLHEHEYPEHRVSSHQHSSYTTPDLGALWLHYGRSPEDIKRFKKFYGDNQTSMHHMRLQVLVHATDISNWLTVGKNNGSIVDRANFKDNIKNIDYQVKFFKSIESLPDDFYISINDETRYVREFNDPEVLYGFVKDDDIRNEYFIIGRSYSPDDPAISEDNIVDTIMEDFGLLYPIYLKIRTTL